MLRYALIALLLFCLAALPALAGRYDPSPFAINGLGLFHGRNSPTLFQDAEKNVALLKEAGINWDRFDFWWGTIETEKGKYDWSFADKVVDFYDKNHINMLPILCYSSAWSKGVSPATDEERARYGEWVYQTVKRYKDRVHCWEIWNEPNIPTFWKPKPNVADYTKLLKVAYKRAKEADPNCTIVGGCPCLIDYVFIRGIIENGGWDSMDVLSVHPYSMAGSPMQMDLKTQLAQLNQIMEATGKPKPVWITEMGWTTKNEREEQDQAKYLAQSFAIARASGVEKLFWFCLNDWGERWGIVRGDHSRKPSFEVYKMLSEQLADTTARFGPCRKERTEVIFTKRDGGEVLMDWANGEPFDAGISYPATAKTVTGQPVEIKDGQIQIGTMPILIYPTAGGIYGPGAAFAQQRKANLVVNGDMRYEGGWNRGRHEGTMKDGNLAWAAAPDSDEKVLAILGAKEAAWDSMPVPVFAGKRYTAIAKIRTEKATGTNRIELAWWHPVGWGWKGSAVSQSVTGDNGWTTLKVSGIAPKDAGFVRVDLVSKGNTGKVWFKDIRLVSDEVPYYW